jgi:hypothetical protein
MEGAILLLFLFSLKRNWKPFLIIEGTLAEALVFILETALFAFLLKEHSKPRRVLYSL